MRNTEQPGMRTKPSPAPPPKQPLKIFVESVSEQKKLYPYQQEIIDMLSNAPDGARFEMNYQTKQGPKLVAIKDDEVYYYTGNGNWEKRGE